MREKHCINSDWIFNKNGVEEKVNLPHTWNGIDGQNGKDYYRGKCFYTKKLPKYNGRVYIEINGANTYCEVKVNGVSAGSHINGYSMFRFELTKLLSKELNDIEISVDNSPDDKLYPQTADFTFYGGLYRDVNIICNVSEAHFALLDKSKNGVYITPTNDGKVFIKSNCEGDISGMTKEFIITDSSGNIVGRSSSPAETRVVCVKVENPILWNGVKSPYLYTLTARLLKNGKTVDEISDRFGFREYKFDSQKGFSLNGEHLKLKGVSRHQDRENLGNALTKNEHIEDIELICSVGANSIRLAHYQQSEDFYSICDEKGLLVWAEIPVISKFSKKKQPQARLMLEELIRQNYNHPSIYCWGIQNEISIASLSPTLIAGIKELNTIAHKLDHTRPTASAEVASCPDGAKLNQITDILGYNQYFGWYVQTANEISKWLDRFHSANPDIKLCLSEYGAEAITTLHSENPIQGDYSEEYQTLFHEKYLKAINEREWLWGSYVWNMFDFGSASRNEGGVKGRNNKGLITIDRKTKKDSFWLYKAYWSDEKFVHITGERFAQRLVGEKEIKIYSNCEEVTLDVNGFKQTLKADKIFKFRVQLQEGKNIITASCGELTHTITVIGSTVENEKYHLAEGEKSLIHNWFEADAKIREDYLSLNDTIGEIVNSIEMQKYIKSQFGKTIKIPFPISAISIKPIASLLNKTKKGKELTTLANQFLQTMKK